MQPNHHLGRALDAQPDHHLGAHPEPAQMMRQPVGARFELAIAQPASPNTTAVAAGVCGRLRGKQRGKVAGATHARSRSTPAGCDAFRRRKDVETADRPFGRWTTSSNRTKRCVSASMLVRSNRSVAYSTTP